MTWTYVIAWSLGLFNYSSWISVTAFLIELSKFIGLDVETFIEVWIFLYGATITANVNLLWNAKCETWRYQTQFRFQMANRRQIAKNSKYFLWTGNNFQQEWANNKGCCIVILWSITWLMTFKNSLIFHIKKSA